MVNGYAMLMPTINRLQMVRAMHVLWHACDVLKTYTIREVLSLFVHILWLNIDMDCVPN